MWVELTRVTLMPRFWNFPRNTNIHFRMCLYLVTCILAVAVSLLCLSRFRCCAYQAPSHLQTNQFHKPYRPANSTFANKPQKTTRFFNPHNITRTPTNNNTYSHNQIPPYSHSWTSNSPNPNSEQPLSPRHNLSRQQTTVQSPSHPTQHHRQNHQPIAKIESNTHDNFSFLYEKIINLQHHWTTPQEKMVQRRGGNKFTGENQE